MSNEGRVFSTTIGRSDVLVIGTLKGLLSEREVVRKAFDDFEPEVLCLHIGKEEIRGLGAVVKGKVENTYLSTTEKIYAREMSRFGEVQIPPPSLVEAYILSRERELPIKPLDFDENTYSELYTELIGGMTIVRQSLRIKNINRKKFRAERPEEFVLEWDRVINRFGGFRRLEKKREERMASRIRRISSKYSRVLAILEYKRMKGIINRLNEEE